MAKIVSTLVVALGLLLMGSVANAQNVCAQYSVTVSSGVTIKATVADFGNGPVCSYFRFRDGLKPGLDDAGFFVPAIYKPGDCPDGQYDGQLCFLRKAPPKEFLYKNGFYAQKTAGKCPYNMVFDGVNCLWRKAPFGTKAISKDGKWYTTLRPSCSLTHHFPDGRPKTETVLGAFDGQVCRVANRPQGATGVAVVQFKGAYYAISDLPKTN